MLKLLLSVFQEEREHSGQRLEERQLSSSLQQREVKGKKILQNNEVKRKNKQEEKRHKGSVLVLSCCIKILPEIQELKTIHVYCLTILWVRNSDRALPQGLMRLKSRFDQIVVHFVI